MDQKQVRKGVRIMYSKEEKIAITEAFLESGLTAAHASRRPGWPGRYLLTKWVDEARKGELPVRVAVPKGHVGERKRHERYSEKTKKEAIKLYEMGRRPIDIARLLGIDCSASVRIWWKKAKKGDRLSEKPFKPKQFESVEEVSLMAKKEVPPEVAALSEAELENACLRAVLDDLKVDGWDLASISNKKKAELGERLRLGTGRALREIIGFLKISKSSYEYHRARLAKPDPLIPLRAMITKLFWENKACYGYRRIWGDLKNAGVRISEKVVRRIMHEEGLSVRYEPKMKKFSSYAGETPDAPENLVERNFRAGLPNVLWLTDITEFSLNGFKCYLSPVIDCFDGKIVSWNKSQRPDAELVNGMLDDAIAALAPGEHPIIHNDRGAHYRWPGWIERCNTGGLIRSMSAKGCSPDNAACEGFFGRLKNEFFYHRRWDCVDFKQFSKELDDFIKWYNDTRIKESLGWMSPVNFRRSFGWAA